MNPIHSAPPLLPQQKNTQTHIHHSRNTTDKITNDRGQATKGQS